MGPVHSLNSHLRTVTLPEPDLLRTPWTDEQVQKLNEYQQNHNFHPYTCGEGKNLIATAQGWVGEINGPVLQTWAFTDSLNPGFIHKKCPAIDYLFESVTRS